MNGVRKALLTAAAVVAATGFAVGMSASAQAGEYGHHHEDPAISVGSNLCAAPWNWDGPLNAVQQQPTTDYSVCKNNQAPSGDFLAVLDDSCLAPWLWEGPGNIAVDQSYTNYDVCKHNQ